MEYCVETDWINEDNNIYDHCYIYPNPENDLYRDFDGFNIQDRCSGYTFDIYSSLEEAIVYSSYNPIYIEFLDFNPEQQEEKDSILEKYI